MIVNNITLPRLFTAQQYIIDNAKRFNVLSCGRRFGKNIILMDVMIRDLLAGKRVAYCEPTYGTSADFWREIKRVLLPATVKSNSSERRIELNTKGTLDFWSLESYNAIRGKKYHKVVINEAAFSPYLKSAWQEVIRATLADYQGDAWFASTPQGINHFKELYERELTSDLWKSFHYTSYDNPKIPASEHDLARLDMTEIFFRQEYLAEFVSGAGTLVRLEDIKYFNECDIELDKLEIVIGVDLAISEKASADYTVCAVLGRNKDTGLIYILDIIRARLSFAKQLAMIVNVAEQWNPSVIGIESVAYQAAAFQELIRTTNLNVKAIHPHKDKVTRAQAIAARYEHGLVYHNNNLIPEFKNELLGFPLVEHDDMVDGVTTAYSLLAEKKKARFIAM